MARVPAVHQRIRSRREQLGLRGFELAERVGISASYVSLIEKGAKVPEEDVAVRIARALEDDEGLYRAWAQATRVRLESVDALQRLKDVAASPRLRRALERGADLEEELEALHLEAGGVASTLAAQNEASARSSLLRPPGRSAVPPAGWLERRSAVRASLPESPAAAVSEAALDLPASPAEPAATEGGGATDRFEAAPPVVAVPILAEGADPEAAGAEAIDHLQLDARLLPRAAGAEIFAYAVGAEAAARLRGAVAIGDYVVLRRSVALAPGRIHAVRHVGRVLLSRVLFKGNALLLLPPEGSTQFEALDVAGEAGLRHLIVGHEVLTLRR